MEKPFKTTLPNGLRVILQENHAAPVVSFNLWANVGSVNETDDEAGLCHLIEHMLFKGTTRRPVGQIAKEVEAAGGDMNAYTSFDETVFYINMSSKRLEVGLDILADAASDPTFDQEELVREKEVVVEEISRAEDNPSQMVSQDLFEKAFTVHTYRRPIAGNRETVRGVSRERLIAFYKKWYVAPNLIFIGVGNFQTDKILPQIEKLYSKIPDGSPPNQKIAVEPVQTDQRVVTRGMHVEGRYMDLAVPIPHFTHPDIPAIDILSHILGGGTSSRLEQVVKEKKQLVSSIVSYPYTPRYPCLLIIGSVLKDRALKETVGAIWKEIERMKEAPPSAVEFARARENIRSSRVYERQTVEAMARKLGYCEGIAGDMNFEDEYFRRLSEITPEDVLGMAQKYLCPERITLSYCHPENESWSAEKIRTWLPPRKPPTRLSVAKKSCSEIQAFRLRSGVKLLVKENHILPLVSIRSASLGGIRRETVQTNGINHLISLLVTKGTTHRTAREIAEETENISGHIDCFMGRNLLGVRGSFLSEKTIEGMELFFDLLLHPSFPESEILMEKGHTYTAIRNEEDSLASVAMKKFLSGLYGKHPYGLPALGTKESVRRLRRKDLIRYYEETIQPKNLILSVTGDVDAAEIRERIEEKLANWKRPGKRLSSPSLPRRPKQPIEIVTKKKKLQAHIVYGFLGTSIKNRDRYSLDVMNAVLSGQGGRLFLELRDKEGLAYAVNSSSSEGIEPGYFAVYMGTDPSKFDKALPGIQRELEKIRNDLITEEELERAKRFLIGNYELDLQRIEAVASLIAYNEIYGLGREELDRFPEKIERVTRKDVFRVARKYILPERSVLSVIKP